MKLKHKNLNTKAKKIQLQVENCVFNDTNNWVRGELSIGGYTFTKAGNFLVIEFVFIEQKDGEISFVHREQITKLVKYTKKEEN